MVSERTCQVSNLLPPDVSFAGPQDLLASLRARTALVVIDMQNAFCHPDGGLAAAGRDTDPQQSIVATVGDLVTAAHYNGVPVIWVIQEHLGAEDRSSMARNVPSHREKHGVASSESWCVRNTWDAELVAPLAGLRREHDHVVKKHRMSSFYSTTLDSLLSIMMVRTIVVAGVGTYVCVESTIRDAYYRDLDVLVPIDTVAGSDPALSAATLRKTHMYFGHLTRTAHVVDAWEALPSGCDHASASAASRREDSQHA